METSRKAVRFASTFCLLALTACGGGGGGGTTPVTNTPTTPTTPAPTTPTAPTPSANISIAGPSTTASSGIGGSGQGSNFTTDPPPIGANITFGSATVGLSPTGAATTIADANISTISATYKGTVTSAGVAYPVFDLSVPALSLTASNVRGDGTPVTATGGGQVTAAVAAMTYTLLGAWTYTPTGSGTSYLGQVVTGYSSATGVPTTGTANYTGNPNVAGGGGVVGAYFVPSGTGSIQGGTLTGNVNMSVNFTANTTTGSFSGMNAKAAGSTTSTPWNNINLSGSLTRSAGGVSVSGNTSTTGAPSGAGTAGFSSAAIGGFSGRLYGPTGQEMGATWMIQEFPGTANGKAAFGTFGAKQ